MRSAFVAVAAVIALASTAGCKGRPPTTSAGSGGSAVVAPAPTPIGSGGSGSSSSSGSVLGSAAPAPGSAAAMPTVDACAIGTRVLDDVTPCATKAEAKSWTMMRQGYSTVASAVGRTGVEGQELCAQLLQSLDRDLQKLGCPLNLSADERAQLDAFVTAWFAQRTPVTPTGDAASDAVITRVARARDRMCACTDLACLKEVDATLDLLGALPKAAPAAAKSLANKLIDDIGRCEARIRSVDTVAPAK